MHVLLVSEDKSLRSLLSVALDRTTYECVPWNSNKTSAATSMDKAALVLFDLGKATDRRWLALARWRWATKLPIIAVGAAAHENSWADAVRALSHGADDFLARPVCAGELVARMEALLRRAEMLAACPSASLAAEEATPGACSVWIRRDPIGHGMLPLEFAPSAHHTTPAEVALMPATSRTSLRHEQSAGHGST